MLVCFGFLDSKFGTGGAVNLNVEPLDRFLFGKGERRVKDEYGRAV
jgi:hypothetical protein